MARDVVAQLRDLVPLRPLDWVESMFIAERQAARFLELSDITTTPVPEEIITDLPRLRVERMWPSPAAGASQWSRGRWVVIINAALPLGAQRTTLAHEFKHIIDHPFINLMYPPVAGISATMRAEVMCDYFAGCLLMPRAWVEQAWENTGHDVAAMARRFSVSVRSMHMRLLQLGLTEPLPQCAKQLIASGYGS